MAKIHKNDTIMDEFEPIDNVLDAISYGMGINPNDGEPYVANPGKMAKDNRHFLDRWFESLSDEMKDKIKNPPHGSNVVDNYVPPRDRPIPEYDELMTVHKPAPYGDMANAGPHFNTPVESNLVDHPPHYTTGKIEAIEYLKDNLPTEAYIGGCEWNVKKYLHRWRYKGHPLDDLKKAQWYLTKLIEAMEGK